MKIRHALIVILFLSGAGRAAAEQVTIHIDGSSEVRSLDMHYFPPELTFKTEFKDANGNNILNAEESATINLIVTNSGEGKARNVAIEVKPATEIPGLTIKGPEKIMLILPGDSSIATFKLSSTFDLPDGETQLQITAVDYFGVQAEPVELPLKTAALPPPKLVVTEYKLNDSGEGESIGNNNGTAEGGETIEVSVSIQNQGTGVARNAIVLVESPNPALTFPGLPLFKLGDLPPKATATVKFTFTTPAGFSSEGKIPLAVHLSEATGKFKASSNIDLTIEPIAE